MNKNAIKLFNLGGRNHLADSVFILQGARSKIKQISLAVGFWLNSSTGKTKKLGERENHFLFAPGRVSGNNN